MPADCPAGTEHFMASGLVFLYLMYYFMGDNGKKGAVRPVPTRAMAHCTNRKAG
jgi:hypothetical protein